MTDDRPNTGPHTGHYWHTCSECDYDFAGPTNGYECPICGAEAACRVGGECVDDEKYTGGSQYE